MDLEQFPILELLWTDIPQRRVSANWIVKAIDIVGYALKSFMDQTKLIANERARL